jgi:hypothetical protein
MRTTLLAVGLIAAGSLAAAVIVDWEGPLPAIGPPVEQICVDTMRRERPDLSWVAPGREDKVRGREVQTVTLGELPSHEGDLVRVAGLLHAEFEWVALYPSRRALEDDWRAPWVELHSLWPSEPILPARWQSISDRCAIVEGTYAGGPGGHLSMFKGTIRDVLRLDVWSTPHRPFTTTPIPPTPP